MDYRIEYKRELLAGGVVSIQSASLEVHDKSIRFTHEIPNAETGELPASTVLVGLHLDMATRKARPLPADVRERIALMIDEGRWIDN
ncbi:hypothetical protein D3879_03510 [Pseudomonas cavernicola]|uniref:Thioesterase n=1 Tax=Pseudomonas cavernicola TaxID=2320866 RepID=A0A418XIX3_9PSED|nr:thioesterase family protein [Pseudomonas cavernicola]RJG12375.1 hypothetical protein D3879_03510 [Pseudomonas cavernicola]